VIIHVLEGFGLIWEALVARLCVLVTLSFGTLLIVLYPVIKNHSSIFALIGLIMGCLVVVLLMYFLFTPQSYPIK
jgi:hypothetical protein